MSNVWENNKILIKADKLAHLIYSVTKKFPEEEKDGISFQ